MRGLEYMQLETSGAERIALAPHRGSIIVMDHHPLYRRALRQLIAMSFKEFEVNEANSFSELSDFLDGDHMVDYVVYDLAADRDSSFAGLLDHRAKHPSIPLLVMSTNDTPQIARRCILFGASAFLPKSLSAKALTNAMRVVISGGIWIPAELDAAEYGVGDSNKLAGGLTPLTDQEISVLILLCEGLFNRQIVDKLGIAESTVKKHVSKILGKLEVSTRTQAVILVTRVDALIATRTEAGRERCVALKSSGLLRHRCR